ncbi:phage shock protein PspA [Psychrosphaera haliotis]|uniref:PspA/IM30 family protein n=1 Tax=Psychrosphaera haliotis TaxID=555083 RepID=UPI0031D477E2
MGVLNRFVDVMNANLNAALDKAEKPEHMLRLIAQDMEEALVEARTHAASLIAEKKHIGRDLETLVKEQNDWQAKAELALSKNREDLARDALVQKEQNSKTVAAIEKQIASIDKDLETISTDTAALNKKLSEVKGKINSTDRRLENAEVRKRSQQVMDTNKVDAVTQRYEQLQRKVDDLESQADAYDVTSRNLHDEFRKLEVESKVDEQLAELKKKVANS